jgi:hypothetical protein
VASLAQQNSDILLGLFLNPEDGGDMSLRDVGWLSTNYTTLYPEDRTLHNHFRENLKSIAVEKRIVKHVESACRCVIWGTRPYCWAQSIRQGPSDLDLRTCTHATGNKKHPAPNCRCEPAHHPSADKSVPNNTASTMQVNRRSVKNLAWHHWSHPDYAFACSLRRCFFRDFIAEGWLNPTC